MKYLSYALTAILSTGFAILLSLSSCSPTPKVTPPSPIFMNHLLITPSQKPIAATKKSTQPPATVTAKIRNFKFEPVNLAIAVGKTVQFINTDEEPHTATAKDGAFDSKGLDTDQTWNYTATKTGTFPYICSIHPFMKGTLTVTSKKT